jgi:hypothetical protein
MPSGVGLLPYPYYTLFRVNAEVFQCHKADQLLFLVKNIRSGWSRPRMVENSDTFVFHTRLRKMIEKIKVAYGYIIIYTAVLLPV